MVRNHSGSRCIRLSFRLTGQSWLAMKLTSRSRLWRKPLGGCGILMPLSLTQLQITYPPLWVNFLGLLRNLASWKRSSPTIMGENSWFSVINLLIFVFLENQIYFPPPFEKPNPTYINWLNRVEKRRKALWPKLGIFVRIQLSRVHLKYNIAMLVVATCFWDSTTNTFHLPCGILTPTLFDLASIASLRPTREDYEPSRPTRTKLDFDFSDRVFDAFIRDHCGSTGDVYSYEHITFLTY